MVSAADLKRTYAFSADLYLEFLKLGSRRNTEYGSIKPTFGIKTKMEWSFYNADNTMNGDGGTETFGLNYAAVPLLFEYCLGYHQGVTRASHTPGTTTYTGRSNYDGSYSVTESSTAGTYNPGGRTSNATFIYFGPKICYLFKSFNYTGDPIVDQNLVNNYYAFVGGVTFCYHQLNLDFSYQKGMTSIYKGKDITIDGFLMTIGINFTNRLYNN